MNERVQFSCRRKSRCFRLLTILFSLQFKSKLHNSTVPTSRPAPDPSPGPDPGPGPEPLSPDASWDTSVQAAIRVGDWKLLTGDPGHGDWVPDQILPSLPGRWWNLERSFSHRSSERSGVWLFNISADPFERHDLSDQRPEVVRVLLQRLVWYNRSAVAVRFPPDDRRADPTRRRGAWEPWILETETETGAGTGTEEEEESRRKTGADKRDKTKKKKKQKRKRGKCHMCKLNAFSTNSTPG
ncbi:hypothetical protein WMY93_000386 [Mugilogobius chulae]|uniref:Uncharacterized protein n=1 Tax=Mugilogobius chulae TaxID=88201 RepID=A0AAW0Q7E6_9GOBI